MVKISNAELEVMKVIWEKGETTSLEIINELGKKQFSWNENTIRTLICRLLRKKAIGISKKESKTYFYVPLVDKEKCKTARTKQLIDSLFNGSTLEFLEFLIDNNPKCKTEMKDLLNRK